MRLAYLLLLLFALSSFNAKGEDRRDGNWWRGHDRQTKVAFVTGFFDGMALGNKFSYWRQANAASSAEATKSYNAMVAQYLSNVTSGQLVDGLEGFYGDFRNRRIRIDNAVWLVLNQIDGMPAAKFEELVENWRRNDK